MERKKRNNDTWQPPVEGQEEYPLYKARKDGAYEAWFARSDYPLLSAKAMTLPEEMYRYLQNVRKAREAEINKERPPAGFGRFFIKGPGRLPDPQRYCG
ncbi:hypothetical protein [Providencia rustigianii]|uniref:hypothetical protein n=1 Tax=Providencia rustigianii TaxID=158850 RepID=UPI00224085C6|nr:hypothetical protein [Providencia rustigianii]